MLRHIIISIFFQAVVLLLLLARDKNDGEKALFQKQRWKPNDVIIIMLLFDISIIALYFMHSYLKCFSTLDLGYLCYLFLFLIVLGFIKVRYRQNDTDFGFKKRIHVKLLIIFFITGSIVFVISSMMLLLATSSKDYLILKKYFYYLNLGFFIIFISSIIEEWIFRGIIYSVYRKKYGAKWAIIISSILFSLVHYKESAGIAFIISIVCSIIYEKKESLILAIGFHGLINTCGFITMIFLDKVQVPIIYGG